jgi:3-dehydroquinate synthase
MPTPDGDLQMKCSYTTAAGRQTLQDVWLDDADLASALDPLRGLTEGRESLVVTTPTVSRLYRDIISAVLPEQTTFLVLDCDESTKDLAQVERICRYACSVPLSRTALLVGVGGGVCTDITTIAAAWLRRGVEHVRVPTTLIGQVDAGIGYKGAVNFGGYKSYLGCFHAPRNVLIAPAFLHSLPPQHLRDGFAEIIKMAIVRDPGLFDLVELYGEELVRTGFRSPWEAGTDIVWRSVVLMLEELAKDPYEDQTFERAVDFGHTFSPLLEAASGYRLAHGAAVAVDMALTTVISAELGLIESASRDRVLSLFRSLDLPLFSSLLTTELCQRSLELAARHRGGRPNLVLPTGIGSVRFLQCSEALGADLFTRAFDTLDAHHDGKETNVVGVVPDSIKAANENSCRAHVDDT